jgi:hypothetical protein
MYAVGDHVLGIDYTAFTISRVESDDKEVTYHRMGSRMRYTANVHKGHFDYA